MRNILLSILSVVKYDRNIANVVNDKNKLKKIVRQRNMLQLKTHSNQIDG